MIHHCLIKCETNGNMRKNSRIVVVSIKIKTKLGLIPRAINLKLVLLDSDEQIGTDKSYENDDSNKKHKHKATKRKDKTHREHDEHAGKP